MILTLYVVPHDATTIHGNHPFTECIYDPFVVGGNHHCCSEFIDLFEYFNNLIGIDRVEVSSRFVSNDKIRLIYNRSSNSNTLLLPMY
jgi:hypothetical protein